MFCDYCRSRHFLRRAFCGEIDRDTINEFAINWHVFIGRNDVVF